MSEEEKIEIVRISEFQEGVDIFTSNGISKVKVTKDGVAKCIEIPIQSTGISELVDTFEANAPKPPVENVLVKPDSEMGKEMGLAKKKWCKVPNLADPEYVKALEEHRSDLGMKILFKGMAVDIKDKDGNIVTDENKKLNILKNMGMSSDQFSQVVEDITSLTKWDEEEKEDFLGE